MRYVNLMLLLSPVTGTCQNVSAHCYHLCVSQQKAANRSDSDSSFWCVRQILLSYLRGLHFSIRKKKIN